MLYQFPPQGWFESGTTSLTALTIVWLALVVGIPVKVLTSRFANPGSRMIWRLAEGLWIVGCIWLEIAMGDLYGATTLLLLLSIPFHLGVSAINALVNGFRSPTEFFGHPVLEWGCATFVALITLWTLLPATCGGYPEASRRSQCKNNLKQIGLAMHNYHDEFAKFPDAQTRSEETPPVSWRVSILPYIEHEKPSVKYDPTEAWNSDKNSSFGKLDLKLYLCRSVPLPDQKDAVGRYYTAYATLTGPGTAFEDGRGKPIREIADGTSNTALVAEACGQQIVWTEPRDIEVSRDNLGLNLPGKKLGQSSGTWSSYHRQGAHTLLADGSVRFLSNSTDPTVLKALSTASGGETVNDY